MHFVIHMCYTNYEIQEKRVFGDASRLELLDEEHSFEEERYITIGSAGDIILILFVVYTERNDCIRIISARKATKEEREVYYLGKENY